MTTAASSPRADTARRALAKVPEITLVFWLLKLLSTGMGEVVSDSRAACRPRRRDRDHRLVRARAVAAAAAARVPRAYYWSAVMMVAVFGTMAADGIHDGAGIPYTVTTPVFALVTGLIFLWWYRSEGTLSIHTINTPRRERFYWAAVLGTFALGTAAGDLTATTLNLGFWPRSCCSPPCSRSRRSAGGGST